jgi:hypothetical protein
MKTNGISASAYQTYSACEWQYFLQYILSFTSESGPAALLGTMAHKVLEILSRAAIVKHDKNSKIWDPSYLWELSFNHYYNDEPHVAEQIQDDKLKKVCKGIHQLLDSEYTPIRDNTISAEAGFNIPMMEPEFKLPGTEDRYFTLRGRIDRVDQLNEDTIEVIDYKSGSRVSWDSPDRHKKEPSDLHAEIQPRMYHLAAKDLYPWAKNILVTFIYFTDGGPVTVPFCDEDIAETRNMLLRRFRSIKNNENPQRNISWKCKKLCSFGTSGVCESVWNEGRELGLPFIESKYTVLNVRKKIKK